MKRWVWLVVVVLGVTLAVAALGRDLLPGGVRDRGGSGGGIASGVATVDTVEVLLMESFPVQAAALVRGNLPDGCTELAQWSVERAGDTFRLTLPTARPADAVCTEALEPFEVRIPLDVEGLAAGVYTVDAGGVTATFQLAVDNHTPQDPTWELSPCEALQGEGEAAFTNPSAGYCLRYPADFAVTEPEPGVVVIHGPDYSGGGLEPLAGFVAIETGEPANGRTARQVSDDVVSGLDLAGGVMVERVDGYLGGVPAVEIIGIPGQRLYRQVVAVQNDRVVDLVFSPIGEEYGQATADMETLYQLVMRSFTFVAPNGSAPHPQAAQGARFVLAQRLDVPQTAVEVVSAEPTTWSDACLGLGRPDEGCAAVLTPGYVVTLMVGDATYVYRADEAGGNIRLASSPEGAGEAQVLTLPLEDEQMRLTLPPSWSVGATRETVLGTLTVVGAAPPDPQADNSAIYVADTTDVPLVHAVKRIFCGPSDCEPDVVLEDVVVGGVPAQRSVPADGVKVTWYFMIHDGKTITFTLHDPATQETLPDVIDLIRFEPSG